MQKFERLDNLILVKQREKYFVFLLAYISFLSKTEMTFLEFVWEIFFASPILLKGLTVLMEYIIGLSVWSLIWSLNQDLFKCIHHSPSAVKVKIMLELKILSKQFPTKVSVLFANFQITLFPLNKDVVIKTDLCDFLKMNYYA